MKPTEMAQFGFNIGSDWAQKVVESSTASEDMKNLAAAVRDIAGGLHSMSTGLRATYIQLEKIEKMLIEQKQRSMLTR